MHHPHHPHRPPILMDALEPRRLLAVTAPLFLDPINLPSALKTARATAAGDFNGDGKLDIAYVTGGYKNERQNGVVVQVFTGQIRFLGGDGKGNFKGIGIAVPLGLEPKSMVVGDFDKNGSADIASSLGSNRAGIFLNTGNATFAPVITYASVDAEAGKTVRGDFNGDGNIDIAISGQRITGFNPTTGQITGLESVIAVHLGLGNGLFTNAIGTRISGNYTLSIAAGDFDGDGRSDLAVGGKTGVQILSSKGDGTFNFPTIFATDKATHVTAADFNGDGRPDVAWAPAGDPGTVEYALSTSTKGKFDDVETLHVSAGGDVASIVAGDIDGDGLIDLVAGPNSAGNGYFINQGGGSFLEVNDVPGARPGLAADFNKDGRLDLISSDGARLYLAAVQPTPPVYLTKKGTIVVNGTRHSDVVTLELSGSRIRTTLNGQTWSFRTSRVKRAQVNTGKGDDDITVSSAIFSSCQILAGAGNDTVEGGAGRDTIEGGSGDDNIFGGRGVDSIVGGPGDDSVNGGKGVDLVFGNAGADTFSSTDAPGERKDVTADDLLA